MSNQTSSLRIVLGLLLAVAAGGTSASDLPDGFVSKLAQLVPGVTEQDVSPTPLPGLYQVIYGARVIYVSADARYLIRGDLLDVDKRRNLSEVARKQARLNELRKIEDKQVIAFKGKNAKHRVTVFTDVDCGYCARLHRQMADYNAAGIEIRYLAFPRAGIGSNSYKKMVSVWCADDPHTAMGRAKERQPIPAKECPNPVGNQFELGRILGVNGTPTMFLDDGTVIPGYVEPKELLSQLERG